MSCRRGLGLLGLLATMAAMACWTLCGGDDEWRTAPIQPLLVPYPNAVTTLGRAASHIARLDRLSSQSELSVDEMRCCLAANTEALALLEQASHQAAAWPRAGDLSRDTLPDWSPAWLLSDCRAQVLVHDGRWAEAARHLSGQAGMAVRLIRRGEVNGIRAGDYWLNMALRRLREISRRMPPNVARDTARGLQPLLDDWPDTATAFAAQRETASAYLRALLSRPAWQVWLNLQRTGRDPTAEWMERATPPERVWQEVRGYYDRLIALAQVPWRQRRAGTPGSVLDLRFAEWEQRRDLVLDPDGIDGDWRPLRRGNIQQPWRQPAARLCATAGERRLLEAQTEVGLIIVVLAVRSWRAEHGRYPASLAQLAPEVIPCVPPDPYGDGAWPIYRPSADGATYRLYGVGINGLDDGGRMDLDASVDGLFGCLE